MKILLATDLSERSDRALRRAVLLCKKLGGELRALHAVDDTLPSVIAKEVKSNAASFLREQIAALDANVATTAKVDVRFGHPWETIVEAANEGGPDLVVMGVHRNRGIADLFAGTTLHRVARAIDKPVLAVRRDPVGNYRNVIVGTDLSKSAAAAAELALKLSNPEALRFVQSYHIPFKGLVMRTDGRGDISARERKQVEDPIRKDLSEWIKSLPQELHRVRSEIREGGPIRVLEDIVLRNDADLLAIGQHSRSGLVEAFLGSVAKELMSSMPTDLLLAPAHT
ncbi:hypothetical protein AN191_16675 [Loktanella sp. 5RATIMAR09]|uniref:universal stress protein n=1 Tax=Loktanella sp. 5RATIMAR09 TaxID=1225655 RepID=UPI00070753C8|nr:universal stress protein [Loktanella sp. 5RATIMAR09]KQI70698.1 hypothetical protein AN191_16675 [Loktanella sp. 5RATIMAR09]